LSQTRALLIRHFRPVRCQWFGEAGKNASENHFRIPMERRISAGGGRAILEQKEDAA
jgi:hypothetical protein